MEKLKLVIILCCGALVASCIIFVATSCSWNGGQVVSDEALQEAYDKLYLGAVSQEELVASLVEFEVANSSHFKSKVDLAQWYFSQGNYVTSWQYLQRALSLVQEAGFTPEKQASISTSLEKGNVFLPKGISVEDFELIHRLLAYLCLFRNDLEEAEKYARRSQALSQFLSHKTEEPVIESFSLYLMGQVLFSRCENEGFSQKENLQEALGYFDRAYELNPQAMTPSHLLGYGKLLALDNRYEEAESTLENYLKNGNWTVDTSLVAKEVYVATKNTYKEKICDFIYEDYVVGAISLDDGELENEIDLKSWLFEYKTMAFSLTEDKPFFGEIYCQIALALEEGRITRGNLDSLVELEPYFVNFPSYYWLLWSVAKEVLKDDDREVFIPALKKIIALNPTGIYGSLARDEIRSLVISQGGEEESIATLDRILF